MTCENETEQVNIRYGVIISAADCNLNEVSPLRRCLVSLDGVEDLAHVAHVLLRYAPGAVLTWKPLLIWIFPVACWLVTPDTTHTCSGIPVGYRSLIRWSVGQLLGLTIRPSGDFVEVTCIRCYMHQRLHASVVL